ncbi:hypothetical protein FJT64_008021 [Amphibalanus amphitrite]|uniref:Uncharacterized protein n=1 Tax=Amphibalanus amphitrite TaxID=1232801 RepID=A0A6A4VXZ8_AMPAM|nr:hypothetical protein FJT64_008021 [Amphibalanus amphitrite]
MTVNRLLLLLAALAAVCAAAAVPVAMPVPADLETDGSLAPAAGFELDPSLLQQTGAALATQHSQLMADTDVFGLYRDGPPSGSAPAAAGGLGPVSSAPVAGGLQKGLAPSLLLNGRMLAPFPEPFADDMLKLPPVEGITEARGDKKVKAATEEGQTPEQDAGGATSQTDGLSQQLEAAEPAPSARPETLATGPESLSDVSPGQTTETQNSHTARNSQPARLQEAVSAEETVVPRRRQTRVASQPQPLQFPDTHIFCLLPEPGRHRGARPAHGKDEQSDPAQASPPAVESGEKHAPSPTAHKDATAGSPVVPAQRRVEPVPSGADNSPLPPPLLPLDPDQQRPLFFQPQLGQNFGPSQQTEPEDRSSVFDQFWNQLGADIPDQPTFDTVPDIDPDLQLDPSTFGQMPGQDQSADGAAQGPQERIASPTFFAPYPRQSRYPQRSTGYYNTPSRSPVAPGRWGTSGGWPAGSAWSHGGRSGRTHRTAYPAPWRGPGRGPTGASGWPWPALATESRGRPRQVPSSGVYLVQQSGQWPRPAGYPLYSQWYRPAVVPLPGGGSGGGGWWSAGRFVRPATAMATSEESAGAGSPPLSADWPWPAVSMLGGRDALVVTGMGRSSGAMARAGGQHGWPPVAMATAGGSRTGGGYSRASTGGFDLIFEDGMFHTGPMALSRSPEEYVPPPKKPTKPSSGSGDTATEDELEGVDTPAESGSEAEEGAVEGSGAEEE